MGHLWVKMGIFGSEVEVEVSSNMYEWSMNVRMRNRQLVG